MVNLSLPLVDDEKPLLMLLQKYLERAGHAVDVSETAQDALMKCRQDPCPFHLVVLDLKLPDLPGDRLLPLLLDACPDLRVLISSGTPFSADSLPEHHRRRVGSLFKPFMPKELLDAIIAMLPAARRASV